MNCRSKTLQNYRVDGILLLGCPWKPNDWIFMSLYMVCIKHMTLKAEARTLLCVPCWKHSKGPCWKPSKGLCSLFWWKPTSFRVVCQLNLDACSQYLPVFCSSWGGGENTNPVLTLQCQFCLGFLASELYKFFSVGEINLSTFPPLFPKGQAHSSRLSLPLVVAARGAHAPVQPWRNLLLLSAARTHDQVLRGEECEIQLQWHLQWQGGQGEHSRGQQYALQTLPLWRFLAVSPRLHDRLSVLMSNTDFSWNEFSIVCSRGEKKVLACQFMYHWHTGNALWFFYAGASFSIHCWQWIWLLRNWSCCANKMNYFF